MSTEALDSCATGSEFSAPRALPARIGSAVRRRSRAYWRSWQGIDPPELIEEAFAALLAFANDAGDAPIDAEIARAVAETLRRFGAKRDAGRLMERGHDVGKSALSGRYDHALELSRSACEHYQAGRLAEGNLALRRLRRRMGRRGDALRTPESVRLACGLLDACWRQVRATFATGGGAAESLAANDSRWQFVAAEFASLPQGALVADVGCGPGRYLRQISQWRPDLRLVGIDPRPDWPSQVKAAQLREGELLALPATDGEFDGVLAVEALEHALLPERAVAELARVTRSGGRILIVDKHRAAQRLSEHFEWERWFEPEEMLGWLGEHCSACRVQPLADPRSGRDSGVYLAWSGTRR